MELATSRALFPEIADAELVVMALLGDLEAFDELVRRFRGAVLAVAEGVLGSRAAEDAAEDGCLLAFKALARLDDRASFPAWLCAIARHRARRLASRRSWAEETGRSELDQLVLECSEELGQEPAEVVL